MNTEIEHEIKASLFKLASIHEFHPYFDLEDEIQLINELSKKIEELDTLVNELECEKMELEERLEIIEYIRMT